MKKHLWMLILIFLIFFIFLSGCTENNIDSKDKNNTSDCLKPSEVDKIEMDFNNLRFFLSNYLNETEFIFSNQSETNQQGILSQYGRQKRLEYEQIRNDYINLAIKGCKKSDNTTLGNKNTYFLKGDDLVNYEIHPEFFLELPIYDKYRTVYKEPDPLIGETTDYVEYEYFKEIENKSVNVWIRLWHVGTDEDQWQWLAKEQGFKSIDFGNDFPLNLTVYYTNDYEDDYGWKYKGVYFQIFQFKIYAGYYSYSESLGTNPEYFNNIDFGEELGKEIFYYLIYNPNSDLN